MLENVLKALDEALLSEKMRTKWEAERRERAEEQARNIEIELEAVKADLKIMHHDYTELQKRYRELEQGLADY